MIRISVLVENKSHHPNIAPAKGLSLWIECFGRKILFDAGPEGVIINNSEQLGIDLSTADAIVLSHGHYDHTEGLEYILDAASRAKIYIHPDAMIKRYSMSTGSPREIGIPEKVKNMIGLRKPVWTETPCEIFPDVMVTGAVPRHTTFEDVGGRFFLDKDCSTPDMIRDDQSLFIKTDKGLVIVAGCAHSGIVNTLEYIRKLTDNAKVHAIIGGMHLLNANPERLHETMKALERVNFDLIAPMHCTGEKPTAMILKSFPNQFIQCNAGDMICI